MPPKIHTFTDTETSSALSESQFQILVDLLTPVHELAVRQLEMMTAAQDTPDRQTLPIEQHHGDSGDENAS